MQNLVAETTRLQDLCPAQLVQLQQPRMLISSDKVVGLDSFREVQKETILGIACSVEIGKSLNPHMRAGQVVNKYAKSTRLESSAKARISTRSLYLFNLIDAGGKLESLLSPCLMDLRRPACWRENCAKEYVGVEHDQHHFCRAQTSASSTIDSISSGVREAFSFLIASAVRS